MSNSKSESFLFFAAGVLVTLVASKLVERKREEKKHAGASVEGEDLSLFYGDIQKLTKITDSQRFLPSEFYGTMVRTCIVVCCDICLVRRNRTTKKRECLLVKRSSDPAKGLWWWPGGRVLKGETFFAAARRKAIQETGIDDVKCIQCLGVWNTVFPTSSWDTETEKGTQTVNSVVLVEITTESGDAPVKLDNQSEQYKWISLDPDQAIQNGEDKYVWKPLQRLKASNPTYYHS
ncbi:Nudix hydrolase [Seminavis robusta]|uniref:Nudix hydrolase n=1 Tax=Seminavis robusta TaxID=568900 RepID=A0A9N8EZW8_9STRA|nr:Nudix hydrolase [Seminavis robusta]|eukprot:Sro2146_g316390.1 Nudix hydrolase (234) ;mRNA; r:1385-2206